MDGLSFGLRIHCLLWGSCLSGGDTVKEGYPEYDTERHLMREMQFWEFGECGVPLHWHYSGVYFHTECEYFIGSSYLRVKTDLFKNLSNMIGRSKVGDRSQG